jgi:hypothetical protein
MRCQELSVTQVVRMFVHQWHREVLAAGQAAVVRMLLLYVC